jgi:chaperonin cofactor prefoldin
LAAATLEQRVTSLERRMSEMEGQLGFLLPTLRQVHLDLLGFKEDVDARFTKVDARFTSLENKVDSLENKVDRMDAKFTRKLSDLDAKVDAMPRAVAEIVSGLIKK